MSSLRVSLAFAFIERWLGIVIALGSSAALARLLTPEALGIYSVSLAVIGVAQVLRDFGVVSFLIQERELTDQHLRTAFGISLVLGSALFLAVYLGAGLAATFYGEPRVALTLQICSLNFLILPFCTVSMAMLRRDMQFKKVAGAGLLGAVCNACVSVTMAWMDFGVASLAWGSVANTTVSGLAAFWFRGQRKLMTPAFTEWRRMLNFGFQSSLTGAITSLSMDVNDIAVGKIMGFEPVAVLSKSQGLMNVFHKDAMGAIRTVMQPAFAKASREGVPIEPFYRSALTNVLVAAWPFYGFVAIYSLESLRLLFGVQWDQAARLVPIFCLAGSIAATASMIGTLFLALGKIELLTKVELIFQPFRALLVVIAALLFESMEACAWALVIALSIQVPLLYAYKADCVKNEWSKLLRDMLHSFFVACCSLAIPLAIALYYGFDRSEPIPAWAFVLAILGCLAGWLLALMRSGHPLSRDRAFVRMCDRLRR